MTAAGSPGFITVQKAIRATRHFSNDVTIHGCDIDSQSIGLEMADKSFVAPAGASSGYIPTLLKYCDKNQIDLVIPCADEELVPLARSKKLFEEIGCRVLIESEGALNIVLDKARLFQFCCENSLTDYIVEYRTCNNAHDLYEIYCELSGLGYKVCVKPAKTHGSRGFRVIEQPPSKKDFFSKKAKSQSITIDSLCRILDGEPFPEILVMEYLPGTEYSVDCFRRDNDFLCVPRTREVIKEGVCVSGTVVKNEQLVEASRYIYNKIGLMYNANIQFKYNSNGEPKLLEINPRFSGTMEHCRAAGINFVEVAIHNIFQLTDRDYDIKWGVKMTRVWDEIFHDENGLFTLGSSQ